ncbi:MAG: pyrroline-5-carboxylate reductase dimerization domain-containing protein [Oscillospiraceae bacterium]
MKIGIIGFGNLGSAFATGLVKQGYLQDDILISDPSDTAVKRAHILGINNTDMNSLILKSDVIVLTVKPAVYHQIEISQEQVLGKTIISCVAGISMKQLAMRFNTQIVRAMPTIAMENLQSVSGLCFDEYAQNKDEIVALFEKLGIVLVDTEDKLENVTALASCGLGFAAYILDCFTKSGENLGYTEAQAIKIVGQTFAAAIEMGDFEQLMARVATKGGITQQGIDFMADANVNKLIDGAVKTAYAKASEYKE